MKNKYFTYYLLPKLVIYCLIIQLIVQCRQDGNIGKVESSSVSLLNVNIDYAVEIAGAFHNSAQNKSARLATGDKDSLLIDTKETYTDGANPVFHVLNYKKEKGWIIIAADRRITPILAYSYTGKFLLNNLGDGVKAWVEGITKIAKNARTKLSAPTDMVEIRWENYEKNGGINAPGGRTATECSSYDQYMHQCPPGVIYANQGYPNSIIGSWGSKWQQYRGYAYSMPTVYWTGVTCSDCGNNVLTGCGPLAASMVLVANNRNKGSHKPTGYNFDQMSDYTTSTCGSMNNYEIELSRLVRFSFDQADAFSFSPTTCQMATFPDHVPNVFAGAGYSNSGQMSDFLTNQSQLMTDLNQGYPVVISGRTCETCYSGWHIWVIDGFHRDTFYNLNCSGSSPICQESAFLFYSMKWGHANHNNADGWYGISNFSENGDVYNSALKVNINARP